MRKIVFLTLFVAGAAGWGHTQEMPPEMKLFWDDYIKDSTAIFGPLEHKKMGIINDSVQIKDLRMRFFQCYQFKRGLSLKEYPDTVALSEIIEPTHHWDVLVMAHNKPLYTLAINTTPGKRRVSMGATPIGPDYVFRSRDWDIILKVYPESTGVNPVFISRMNGSSFDNFLYFKEKGPRKIYFFPGRDDTLSSMFTYSLKTLDDSRKLIAYWKQKELNENKAGADERMGLEKTKSVGNDEKVEPKWGSNPAIYSPGALEHFNEKFKALSIPEGGVK